MKNLQLSPFLAVFLLICFSCQKEGSNYSFEEEFAIKGVKESKLSTISYLLTYDKKTYSFTTKKEMLSFLAVNEKSARYFFFEWVAKDLHDKYIDKYGKDYLKDNSLIDQLREQIEEEINEEDLTIESEFLDCILCRIQNSDCVYIYLFREADISMKLYDNANYEGERLDITEKQFVGILSDCKEIIGSMDIPALYFNGIGLNDRVSSFKFSNGLRYESMLLTFFSEPEMRGAEHTYFMRAYEREKNDPDLSEYLWRIQGLPLPVDNNISSIRISATGLQRE